MKKKTKRVEALKEFLDAAKSLKREFDKDRAPVAERPTHQVKQ